MNLARTSARAPRLARATLACTFALGLITACSSSSEPANTEGAGGTTTVLAPEGDPVDGGTLAVGVLADTTGWNPTADQWGVSPAFAGSSMMESLTTLDAEGVALPWLATDWKANDDFTTWTITLREGVTFHDGTSFDAAAVVANFEDVLKSPLTSISLGGAVEGADEINPTTVEIDLSAPWASFASSFLAGPNAWMRAPSMLAAGPDGSTNPVGTGPFKFESAEIGTSLKVVKYDDYWREGEPHLQAIEFLPITDDISRANALQSGDIDMMLTTSATDAADAGEGYQVIKDWDTETTLLVVNTRETAGGEPNPLANEHARKAVAHATDPEVIASLVGDDLEVPTSPFSADNPWSDPSVGDSYPSFDVAKAKEEVEAYKQDTGEATLTVKLLGSSDTGTVAQLQALAAQWSEAGIETDIEAIEYSTMSIRGVQGNFQLIFGPIYSAPDPDQNYHFLSETTVAEDGAIGINFAGYATEATQDALDRGRESENVDERKKAYNDLFRELNDSAVNIWLYFTPYSIVAEDRVHGLQLASELPFGNFQPKTWWGQVWVDG
jgi:peptide/nickel transport system substrate-binding protein